MLSASNRDTMGGPLGMLNAFEATLDAWLEDACLHVSIHPLFG